MTVDATFWVAISFFIFVGGLIYLKLPQKINKSLPDQIKSIKNELDEAENRLRNDFIANQQKERDFVDTINKKYGDGNLDLGTGVFTPRPAAETTDKTL